MSKMQVAPPPVFRMISFGSIVYLNLEALSLLEPAAPWEGAPGSSLASRPAFSATRSWDRSCAIPGGGALGWQ